MKDELFDIVDDNDNIVGQATRQEAHTKGLMHRTVFFFILNKQGRVFVNKRAESKEFYDGYHSILFGGHVSKGQTYEDAVKREVQEEADLKIKNIKRVGYIKVIPRDGSKIHYLLRYTAFVDKINNQTEDPAVGEILERKFIDPKEICKYIDWGNCEFQLNKAIKVYNNL